MIDDCEHLGVGKTICRWAAKCPFLEKCLARRLKERQEANKPWEKPNG